MQKLRSAIVATYYPDLGIEDADIFVSDGAKCDISRLQVLRGLSLSLSLSVILLTLTILNIFLVQCFRSFLDLM
jgi:hypothetical protein